MAYQETFRQGGGEPGKWWRLGALGVSGFVLALVAISEINLAISRI